MLYEVITDWQLGYMFGNPPKTVLEDETIVPDFEELEYNWEEIYDLVEQTIQLESVACKDWLTSKVDRSVTGRT